MLKSSRIIFLSLLGGFALCGASAATAQVETCEVAQLFGEVDRTLCANAELSRQPVICAAAMKKRGIREKEIIDVCKGTRNARLAVKCYDKHGSGKINPGASCGSFFANEKFEPAVYEEQTCSLPNAKQLGSHLPKNINLNDLKRIIK